MMRFTAPVRPQAGRTELVQPWHQLIPCNTILFRSPGAGTMRRPVAPALAIKRPRESCELSRGLMIRSDRCSLPPDSARFLLRRNCARVQS